MAGWKRERKIYRLVFEDLEFEGLEVRTYSTSMRNVLAVQRLAEIQDPMHLSDDELKLFHSIIDTFQDSLVSWNITDEDDVPVPADREGLLSQEPDIVYTIMMEWITAIAGVPAPLAQRSNGGPPLELGEIPMSPLPPSSMTPG